MLALNFAGRTFPYRRLTQAPSRSLSAGTSFKREYSNPVNKADQCAQFVHDIGPASTSPEQLNTKLWAVFKCIQNAGLELTMAKCHFRTKEVDFLGRTITPDGVTPQIKQITKFLEKIKFFRFKKALQRINGFLNYYRKYIPRLQERINPFFQILRTTGKKKRSS